MRSATSCFNKTIIRTDVKRFWPLLFLYTGIWTVMLPVYQWVELDYGYRAHPGDYLYDVLTGSLVMALIFGCLFAVAVFSYLMNSRSVGLMHSQPVTMQQSVARAKKKNSTRVVTSSHIPMARKATSPWIICTSTVSTATASLPAVSIPMTDATWELNWVPRLTGRECISPTERLFIR